MPRLGRSRPARSYKLVQPVANFSPTPVAQADAAGAAEALAAAVAAPQADAAGAVESLAIALAVADAAGATDATVVAATAPQADTAGAVESLTASVTAPVAETAGAADSMAIAVGPLVLDVAGAADSILVQAAVPTAETAGAAEAMTFPVPIAAAQREAAGAVDSMSVDVAGTPTFGGTLPGVILTQALPPGYQGGPSGAGSIPPSALGNGWEIDVRSGADYTTLLAVIPGTMLLNWQLARMLNDIGSGTAVLNQDDPWWSEVTLPGGLPAETLLDEECLWQVWKDGVCRFEFFGETVTEQLADASEQRIVTVTGPGTLTSLKWAMIAPQGFPNIVLKLDGLLDTFDEVDITGQPVLDTNVWTTATPSGSVYITPITPIFNFPSGVSFGAGNLFPSGSLTLAATPGTTFLGASPYDATDTLISAQVTPIGVSSSATDTTTPAAYGTGLDGSELTQFYIQSNFAAGNYALIGLSASAFYAQVGSGGHVQTKVLPAYDSQAHSNWMITEQAGSGSSPGTFYFWTSPDGQSWTLQWQVVHTWDASNVTFFVTATYDVAGKQTVQLSNLNSNVSTPSYQGQIYLGKPMMAVWLDQLSQAQARGTVPFVTSSVTAATDSYGRTWTDTENVQTTNGTNLYSFLQGATSVVNADYVMNPGFQLVVGMPSPGQVAVGVDRSSYIIFREGHDVMARQRVRARDQIATLVGGENADGHEISAVAPAFVTEWGQREAWFQVGAQVDPVSMAYATASSLAENETEIVSWTFQLLPNVPGKTIFDNFDVGDWVGLERPDFSGIDVVRVVGIAVSVDSTGAESHELTFMSYIQWVAEQLKYLAGKLGGSFVNTLGTTPVAPSKFGSSQVPTYFTPAATLSGLADVSSSAGAALGTAPLVYNPATGQYQHAGSTDPVTGQMIPVTVTTPAGSATLSDTTVVVTTGNGATTIGLQGDGTVTTVDSGGNAPAAPDTPAVVGTVQGISVFWDGLLAGALPLANFQYVEYHVSTTNGFTPSTATLVHTQATGSAISVTGLVPGTTYYVKLVARSTAGIASVPSAQASAVAAGLPTSELTGQLPASLLGNTAGYALNPNPFFNGGDLTGWFVTNGTVSAVAPPAGAPGAAQFAARIISTSANCLLSGSPAPFPTTPGQPYAMTAWAYNPGGSSVNVAIGFNWSGGTVTVSVAPGAWVPLATVQNCPGGVTSAYQVIGPTASGVTLYVLGAVAIGQVPGQLIASASIAAQQIAANTITATQIAANTITAAQIAANTITAGQIAASTITAAQIAASTITASQIAAGTITAAQIAANTITATQIAAGTITASQIAAGTILAGAVDGTTITGAQIIADGTSGEVLVYSGSPSSGNLLVAISGAAGSDGSGNPYSTGVTLAGLGSTPTAISGSAILYGTSAGSLQCVDGLDGNVYQTQRLTKKLTSNFTTTTTTQQTLWSIPIGSRDYRITAWLLITANSAVAPAFNIAAPAGSGGQFSAVISRSSGFYDLANFGVNSPVSLTAAGNMVNGNTYVVVLDGILSPSGSGSVSIQVACATTPNSLTVVTPSFIDLTPV